MENQPEVRWSEIFEEVLRHTEFVDGTVGHFQWSVKPGKSAAGDTYTTLRIWPTPVEIYGGPKDGAIECGGVLYNVGQISNVFEEMPHLLFCGCEGAGHVMLGGTHVFGAIILDLYVAPIDDKIKPTLVSDYRTNETWPKV